MNVTVYPARLSGRVAAPPSKSCAHRLLIAAALARGETVISRPGGNRDVEATADCLRALGAQVSGDENQLRVRGGLGAAGPATLDCGESGSTLRFLLPVAALLDREIAFTGRGRLPQRPVEAVLSALRENGAAFRQVGADSLPLIMAGGLKSGEYRVPGNVSSQFFSGLLLALPLLSGDSRVVCASPLESAAYVELTRQALARFGIVSVPTEDGWIVPGGQTYVSPGRVDTESDWSSAAFWLGAKALGADVTLAEGLNSQSCQPDRAAETLLSQIGGEIDVSAAPDLMPILSAVAAASPGKVTRITGAARLRIKESDRLSAMAACVRAMGGRVQELPDGLVIRGQPLAGGPVDGAGDHRVVMSAAVAACFASGPTQITGAEAVEKSYPEFWKDLAGVGGDVRET